MSDAPITNLQVLQRGKEVTPGTLVAATHRVPIEPGSLKFDPAWDRIRRRNSGSAATSHSSSTTLQHPTVGWTERLTYDYMAVLLETFLGEATITGALADKAWAFLPSDSAPNSVVRHSLEVGGVDTWAEEELFAGCVGESAEITWNKSDDVMANITMRAVENTQGDKTASLALPNTLVHMLGRFARTYIDPSTFGSTSWGRILSGSIKLEQTLSERFGSDGEDHANRIVAVRRNITASVIAEYDATTLRDALRASTLQKFRLAFPGPTLGGSTYDGRFDLPGTWDTSDIGDDNGIVTLAHDLTAEFNTSLGADIAARVVCSIADVP